MLPTAVAAVAVKGARENGVKIRLINYCFLLVETRAAVRFAYDYTIL